MKRWACIVAVCMGAVVFTYTAAGRSVADLVEQVSASVVYIEDLVIL